MQGGVKEEYRYLYAPGYATACISKILAAYAAYLCLEPPNHYCFCLLRNPDTLVTKYRTGGVQIPVLVKEGWWELDILFLSQQPHVAQYSALLLRYDIGGGKGRGRDKYLGAASIAPFNTQASHDHPQTSPSQYDHHTKNPSAPSFHTSPVRSVLSSPPPPPPPTMQGFNMGRYVPPDLEGTTTGNKLHSKLPPGRRASKPGTQTVRFEMPFAVWCDHCPKPTLIGQGVRFNAEKRRAGNYYTTPIWSFRIRHADCGGDLELRTDPQNTAYVVVSGGRKRDDGTDEERKRQQQDGSLVILTDAEREALRKSAFASLERTIEDREALRAASERIDQLEDVSHRQWDDPYERNRALRRAFRVGRKEREKQALADDALRDRIGANIELLPATEEDARRAALVDFGTAPEEEGEEGEEEQEEGVGVKRRRPHKAVAKPLFATASTAAALPKGTPKADVLAAKRRQGFVSEVVRNTRAAHDPFLLDNRAFGSASGRTPARIPGVKRKRAVDEGGGNEKTRANGGVPRAEPPIQASAPKPALISYGGNDSTIVFPSRFSLLFSRQQAFSACNTNGIPLTSLTGGSIRSRREVVRSMRKQEEAGPHSKFTNFADLQKSLKKSGRRP
ncbi:hypothetical protein ACRALDRAFT_210933 [Sodiomyces alcalophilus JCM 7366]|uniref:uncharacterized protein n=1 Tax=Sodiomyces alcalophilus JCM 7366 TaxID=591952 RepID=UPI0039B52550